MKKLLKPRKTASQERSQSTIETILAAAARILTQDPDRLSTNRIAERAGVSIGSLYQYFPGKEAILSELVKRFIEGELSAIEKNLAESAEHESDPERLIERFAEFIVQLKIKNLKMERALFSYFVHLGDMELFRKLDEQVIHRVAVILEPRRTPEFHYYPECTVFLLFHAIRGAVIGTSLQRPERLSDPAFKQELVMLMKGYLLPGKSRVSRS